MIFPSDVKIDTDRNVWMISDRMPRFLIASLDFSKTNFRIFKAKLNDLIEGTICDPRRSGEPELVLNQYGSEELSNRFGGETLVQGTVPVGQTLLQSSGPITSDIKPVTEHPHWHHNHNQHGHGHGHGHGGWNGQHDPEWHKKNDHWLHQQTNIGQKTENKGPNPGDRYLGVARNYGK